MASVATAKNTGISAKKVKLIVDLVRGKRVEDALDTLKFLPSPAAYQVAKVVKSARANADNEMSVNRSELRITEIYVDEGPRLKRIRALARGRAGRINRRSSHVTVVVDGKVGTNG